MPRTESLACVLEAFLAVRALRVNRGIELDRCYLENLRIVGASLLTQRQIDPDAVPKAAGNLIRELRMGKSSANAVFGGRNLYVALKDESLDGVALMNEALFDRLPVLYRLAARGHWIREGLPVRRLPARSGFCSLSIPPITCKDYCVSIIVASEGELELSILMECKGVSYMLNRFPEIREFNSMLERLTAGGRWQAREFIGGTTTADGTATRFYFRHQRQAITISFDHEEWKSLKACVRQALAAPELVPVVNELSLAYGEI